MNIDQAILFGVPRPIIKFIRLFVVGVEELSNVHPIGLRCVT